MEKNNFMKNSAAFPQENFQQLPAMHEDPDPEMLKKNIKKGYGWSGLSMVCQFFIMMGFAILASTIYSAAAKVGFMADNPGATQKQIMEFSNSLSGNARYIITVNALSYLIANIAAVAGGIGATKKFKLKEFFGKTKLTSGNIALGVIAILGIQAVSVFIQILITTITGYSGISNESAAAIGFSSDMIANIILVLYMVIIAPITEELLCRGFVMNILSPVNTRFALIVSSILFGLTHGNFNQIFNGIILGLLIGYIAMKSGSLKYSIIAHMTANANALFCSYFYEYKILNELGEDTANMYEMIHFGILLVVGIIALIFFLKKNGKITNDDRITSYAADHAIAEEKGLTWKLLLKCPSVWVITIIYVIMAVSEVSAV